MKKLLLVLFLMININLMASNHYVTAEEKIYTSVLQALYGNKNLKIWCDDKMKSDIFSHIAHVSLTKNPQNADILFVFHSFDIVSKKPKFVGSYALLKHYRSEAIGGFYWQKGRPNLLFLRANLSKAHLMLSKALQKYIEDSF